MYNAASAEFLLFRIIGLDIIRSRAGPQLQELGD